MRIAEMWLDAATVTHRRRRLDAVLALMGLQGHTCHYDGGRFLSIHRDRFGASLSTHPTAASARSYLHAMRGGGAWLDLDRGGIQIIASPNPRSA